MLSVVVREYVLNKDIITFSTETHKSIMLSPITTTGRSATSPSVHCNETGTNAYKYEVVYVSHAADNMSMQRPVFTDNPM